MGDFWQVMPPLRSILQNPGKTTVLPGLPGWAWKVLNLYGCNTVLEMSIFEKMVSLEQRKPRKPNLIFGVVDIKTDIKKPQTSQ